MIVIADEINRKLSYLHLTTIAYNNKFSYYVYFSTFSSRKDYYTCISVYIRKMKKKKMMF